MQTQRFYTTSSAGKGPTIRPRRLARLMGWTRPPTNHELAQEIRRQGPGRIRDALLEMARVRGGSDKDVGGVLLELVALLDEFEAL